MGMLNHLKFPVRAAAERNEIASNADGDPVRRRGIASAIQKRAAKSKHQRKRRTPSGKNEQLLTYQDSNSPWQTSWVGLSKRSVASS
jgi:hypothetical protein